MGELRPQRQRLVFAVLVVLLGVAAGLAAAQKWPGAAWPVISVAAALAVVVTGVGPIWQRRHEQRTAGAGVIRRSVQNGARTFAGTSLDDLRVHTAVVDVAYLPRAAKEREVQEHLRARRPVVIVGPPGWDVLRLFEVVTLDRRRDGPAEEDVRRAIPDAAVRERIARIGIGEYVGAAQHVRNQLSAGAHANPLGHALVVGAGDWARAGLAQPVPGELLPQLAAPHLSSRQQGELADEAKYSAALDWATREINPAVSLLEPVGGAYRVYDFALDQLATGNEPIPATTWQLAIDSADDDGGLYSLGFQAMVNHALPSPARQAFTRAAELGNAMAMSSLGVLLLQDGRLDEAERWLRQAVDAGGTDAMSNLGLLRQQRGDPAEAERWFRRGAEAGHPTAMSNLGVLLARRHGALDEAERWFRQAADAGHADADANLVALSELRSRDT
ncbi:tetratricopeptide repeat protein [Amycolatopsis sp. lyj-23]|uniref:tetratricopeptide repeat protein n=1 Tax=Amycolatopsis sp. lyj-23 TaxID=2789283 RepID=UPI00397A5CB8